MALVAASLLAIVSTMWDADLMESWASEVSHLGGLGRWMPGLKSWTSDWTVVKELEVEIDSLAVTTTAKEKTRRKPLPGIHLIGQQPILTTSFPTLMTFDQQIIPAYLLFYHLNQ